MYRYDRPLEPDEVCVHLWKHDDWPDFEELCDRISAASRRYGFAFREVGAADLGPAGPCPYVHCLLIVVSSGPFDAAVAGEVLDMIGGRYTNASVAFTYADEAAMLRHRDDVELYKRRSEDRINFLRPVRAPDGSYRVPLAKLADNAVCDSVRIKYRPLRIEERVDLPVEVQAFFEQASGIFGSEKLFHRSSTDGYFACRDETGSGFYITATKTCKVDLLFNRISHVQNYDRASNTLEYSGEFLPSSDSVEAAIVFSDLPGVCSIVHTHASDLFTRNPEYRHKVVVPALPYGEVALGEIIVETLQREEDGFVIMDDHGEIFASGDRSLPKTLMTELQRAGNRKPA
jgi:hypothetical protein